MAYAWVRTATFFARAYAIPTYLHYNYAIN